MGNMEKQRNIPHGGHCYTYRLQTGLPELPVPTLSFITINESSSETHRAFPVVGKGRGRAYHNRGLSPRVITLRSYMKMTAQSSHFCPLHTW